jgi:type I restriction enzyme R subunit
MPAKHKEIAFEAAIEAHLLAQGGYEKGDPAHYDRARALDASVLIPFIQATQPKTWQTIFDYHGDNAAQTLLGDLTKALASLGMLHVLRHGFNCFGRTVRVAYFAPASGMNPDYQALYAANRLTVTRQVHFSEESEQSIDLLLAVNGLPVATAELKNPMTGQNVHDAMRQYRENRDPKAPLFRFKERALVHFAVDPDRAFMTTKLDGKSTWFLPFNRGDGLGAGNPVNPDGHKTAYLWEKVWQRDSLLEILGRYLHLQKEEKDVAITKGGKTTVRKVHKETMIFPRYHQLDAVRGLLGATRRQGVGRNYLVQHSAGSGKSNSIAWLAHQLSSLHDAQDRKVFDSVIVITDRRVLDKQLQDNIYEFEHKQGVVKKIDENSAQLAEALKDGTPIIITTLQKFPFVTEKVGELAARRYAVIVDEAHSSQSGEQAAELKGILNDAELRRKAKELAQEEGVEDSSEEAVLLTMLKRGRQPNISFYAFTATPKHKTLKIFDEPGPSGEAPFHLYSMRQAIEEDFILDVLAHYTTYHAYFGLIKDIEDDPLVERKKAAKALARFMQHHPHNVASKVEVMVEHFRTHTRHKIGGRAKAMVVTDSRLAAVRYKQAFDKYIAEKGYDIRTIVAFSGSVTDPDVPAVSYTEEGMNGFREKELPDKFGSEEYQILLVAEKYQTGFDQPLLHTMYVDKRLDGVQAVQTLSRLNRTCPGKEDTFVLDFRNERDDILRAFKPYYEVTEAEPTVSPHKLYELKAKMDGAQVYHQAEVEEFVAVFFTLDGDQSAKAHAKLNQLLDAAVDRFKELAEDAQDEFRGWLEGFRNLYAFLSQIIPYQDSKLEKLYTYLRFLATKLPRRKQDPLDLEGEVQLKFYRLQKVSEGQIDLGDGEAKPLRGPSDQGPMGRHEEAVPLSTLIDQLNDRFGTDFRPADQLFFDQIEAEALEREDIQRAAKANTFDDFRLVFEKELDGMFIDRMEGNEDIFRRVMQDEEFRSVAAGYLMNRIFRQARQSPAGD